jgi:hypothetical protein
MAKKLSSQALVGVVGRAMRKISTKLDTDRKRKIDLFDCLMSGYAMFSLKYPSLLQFDQHFEAEIAKGNLKSLYGIQEVPCDTYMRERLDEVTPHLVREGFKGLFAVLQRSKYLSHFSFLEEFYLVPLDGTGYFYSDTVHCEHCCEKKHSNGKTSYYHQMLVGSLVHPDYKIALPFAPEPIMKTDGSTKNDCEIRAAERFLTDFKREHPHLKVIITGDSLFSKGPFIKRLKADGHRFILVAKEGDHKALFEEFRSLPQQSYECRRGKITHRFSYVNELAINDSHTDCMVNVLEYWETNGKGKEQHWVWVTDIPLNEANVFEIMRGGRARCKIENETFNTLKNQGYHFEHNFGHGNKYLSTVFSYLMTLAFFVDQLQQLGSKVFKKALARLVSKKSLWERLRALFFDFIIESWDDLMLSLANGHEQKPLKPNTS